MNEGPVEGLSPVLVTGATGNIGAAVVARLVARDRLVRAGVPGGVDLSAADGPLVDTVRFDFTDSSTWSGAYAGVEVMFLMRPPPISNIARDMVPSLEAAKAAGIKQVVLLSLQGAEHNKVVPHAKIEAWLRSSGLEWTFVRPSFFMENLSGTHAPDIRDHHEIVVPAGSGATAFVAADDIAAVAAAALLDPQAHRNLAWTPTGPEALTYDQVAATLSAVLDRPIRYTRPGVLRYAVHAKRALGMPLPMVGVTSAIYTVARFGKAGGLTDDVQTVTGAPPTSFDDWAWAHRDAWTDDA